MKESSPLETHKEAPKALTLERAGSDIVISLSKDNPRVIESIASIASAVENSYTDLGGGDMLEVDIDEKEGTLTVKNAIVADAEVSDEIYDAVTARVERLNTVF